MQNRYSAQSTPTCNRIAARTPITRCFMPSFNPRHVSRHEPRARRTSHARLESQLFGQILQRRSLRRERADRNDRLRRSRALAVEHKPNLILAGASAYPRVIDFKRFREIADKVGAVFMVDMAHIAGLVAAGLHPNPVEYADIVTTTTHKTLRGPRGGMILCKEQYAKAIDKAIFPGTQGGPLEHIIAAKAVAFKEAASDDFKNINRRLLKTPRRWRTNLPRVASISCRAERTII